MVRVGLFSDVHANLPALEAFVSATRGEVDAYVCIGDVVNYGPWNDECVQLVCSLPAIRYLEGNHERLFLGRSEVSDEIPLVRQFFEASRPLFTRTDLISALEETYQLGAYTCIHTLEGDRRIYPDTVVNVERSHVIGHTHHQFRTPSGPYEVVNCGSVGQNRAFVDVVNYGIYDDRTGVISLESRPYPVDLFIGEMVARRYPEDCVAYYRKKKRAHA